MSSAKQPLRRDHGAAAMSGGPDSPPIVPLYESQALLGSGREIVIRHGGECYRLRVTRQNKLILTK